MQGKGQESESIAHLLYSLIRKRTKKKKKKEEERDPILDLYKRYCTKGEKVSKEIEEAVYLLGWDIDPGCVRAAAKKVASLALVAGIGFVISYIGFLVMVQGIGPHELPSYLLFEISTGNLSVLIPLLMPVLLYFLTYFYLLTYPLSRRDKILKEMLPELPETIGYFVLAMKLTPNLEKALEFAGENGEGRLAKEFRKLLWEIRMGLHASTEEALDRLAYKWGKFLQEIKHAIMRIRGAVLEADEGRRHTRLDEALKEVITGVKERMNTLASKMYMPSVQLFYLGVFLPLLLFIILPVAAAFTELPLATLPFLVTVYLLVLPLLTFAFAKSILEKRPSFYEPPVPPESLVPNFSSLKRRALFLSTIVLLLSVAVGYFFHLNFDYTYDRIEEEYCGYKGCLLAKYGYTLWEDALSDPNIAVIISSYDTTPYWLVFGTIFGIVAAIATYLYITQKPRADLERDFEEMEGEFRDTVYLLASRMGEGKPFEGALDSLMEFMPDSLVVKRVYSKIAYNIRVLGLSLYDAIFDPLFGALREIPSKFLRKALTIVVKAVELGTELASKALLSYSEQLRYEEEIIRSIRERMSEIYTMMMTMAVLVGPIVLGITVALQQVIIRSVMTYQPVEVPEELAYQMGISLPQWGGLEGKAASPLEFLVVVFLYNIILTVLLTYYAVKVYEGENKPKLLLSIARNLVISSLLFMLSSWLSINLVRGMLA